MGPIEMWFGNKFYPALHRANKVIVLVYAILCIVYLSFAVQVEPDPDPPQLFPEGENFVEVNQKLADNFKGNANPRRMTAQLVFGISSLDRTGTDPTLAEDVGQVIWDEDFMSPPTIPEVQTFVINLCKNAREDKTAEERKVYKADASIPVPVRCWMESLRDHVLRNGSAWPVQSGPQFRGFVQSWIMGAVHPDDPFYAPGKTNYDVWKPMLFAEGSENSNVLRMFIIEVELSLEATDPFEDGIVAYDAWNSWMKDQVLSAPKGLNTGFVTDVGRFHYFFLQRTILREAIGGIILSLVLAFVILCLATQNVKLALWAIACITSLVVSVVAFTVMMGWKLGILEAVIYVMVVGMSVDYCVHLSDAYIEAEADDRASRVRSMLLHMGVSIVSGAVSTLGASMFLLFAFISFFGKFGSVMFFLIFHSLAFSLIGYAACLDLFGPQGTEGRIYVPIYQTLSRCSESFSAWLNNDAETERRRLERRLDALTYGVEVLIRASKDAEAMRQEDSDAAAAATLSGSGAGAGGGGAEEEEERGLLSDGGVAAAGGALYK